MLLVVLQQKYENIVVLQQKYENVTCGTSAEKWECYLWYVSRNTRFLPGIWFLLLSITERKIT